MSERIEYSLNGVYRCEDFSEKFLNENFPSEPIGSAGGFADWRIQLRIGLNNELFIYPFIYSNAVDKELGINYLFRVIKKDGSTTFLYNYRNTISQFLETDKGPAGLKMNIFELLNEKNGYLDNGALVIEYGIQVESILGKDNIWRFNTEDPVFECEKKKNMIQIHNPNAIYLTDSYVHKQLLTFHSSYFEISEDEGNLIKSTSDKDCFDELEHFIQICQGVHEGHLNVWHLSRIMNIARFYSSNNVIHYCERQLIENDLKFNHMKSWVIHLDILKHYLVHLLKNVKSPKEMIDEDDVEKMKGKTMKMFVAKFLYNKF